VLPICKYLYKNQFSLTIFVNLNFPYSVHFSLASRRVETLPADSASLQILIACQGPHAESKVKLQSVGFWPVTIVLAHFFGHKSGLEEARRMILHSFNNPIREPSKCLIVHSLLAKSWTKLKKILFI
jgi:hypothetical protein